VLRLRRSGVVGWKGLAKAAAREENRRKPAQTTMNLKPSGKSRLSPGRSIIFTMFILGTSLSRAAGDDWDAAAMSFSGQSQFRVTVTVSSQKAGGQPVAFAIQELAIHDHKAYIYSQILRPDLVPKDGNEQNERSLFYENGEVKEENLKDKTWVKYKCTESEFVDYLDYATGLWMFGDFAKDALINQAKYSKIEAKDTITFKPVKVNPEFPVEIVSIWKGSPVRLAGIMFSPTIVQPLSLSFQYDYNSKNLIGNNPDKPPESVREIANPLKQRMVYP